MKVALMSRKRLTIAPIRLLQSLAVALMLFLFANGIGGQIQTALFGDEVVPSVASAKAFLILTFFAGLAFSHRLSWSSLEAPLYLSSLLLIAFLSVHLLWLVIGQGISLGTALGSYFVYYLYLLMLPLAAVFGARLRHTTAMRMLLTLGAVTAALGIAQWLLADPLLAVSGSAGNFHVQSWEFYGGVRGFGLGVSAYDIGFLLTLSLCIALAALRWGRWRWSMLPLVALFGAALYATLTRNVYLEAAYAATTVLLLARLKSRPMLLLPLPLLFGAANFYLVWYNSADALRQGIQAGFQGGVDNTATLSVRLEQWLYLFQDTRDAGMGPLLLGTGLVQGGQFTDSVLLDNTFLAVFVHAGLLGLLCVLTVFAALWAYALRRSQESPLTLGIAAAIAPCLAVGVFNIAIGVYGLFALLLLCLSRRT